MHSTALSVKLQNQPVLIARGATARNPSERLLGIEGSGKVVETGGGFYASTFLRKQATSKRAEWSLKGFMVHIYMYMYIYI